MKAQGKFNKWFNDYMILGYCIIGENGEYIDPIEHDSITWE